MYDLLDVPNEFAQRMNVVADYVKSIPSFTASDRGLDIQPLHFPAADGADLLFKFDNESVIN